MGSDSTPEHVQFTIEQSFWQRFGWTVKDLETKPRRQISDYLKIIHLYAAKDKEDAARAAIRPR